MLLNRHWPAGQFLDLITAPECRVHFGQFGEDVFLADLFQHKRGGFYVDVGCHDPYRFSNTFLLWKVLGWTGINIDADVKTIQRFQSARPGDININIGIGSEYGTADFAVFNEGAVSTFDSMTAANQQSQFGTPEILKVAVSPLRTVLDEHLPNGTVIDYMNVDCEGLDETVLRSNDWAKYRPTFINAEVHGVNLEAPSDHPVIKLMQDNGYRLHSMFWETALFERR